MKNLEQKYMAVFQDERLNRRPEYFNRLRGVWDCEPEDKKNATEYHFDNEGELKDTMEELGIINYHIEDVYWPEEL